MLDLSRKNILELSQATGFIKDNVEKVLRLIDILELTFDSKWKDKLVLKGGTGINLLYRNVERLSVDIDLDYIGNSKSQMLEDRESIKNFFINSLFIKNYALSRKSKENYALSSMIFQYSNNAGNIDNIKIEINYLDRIHIYETIHKKIDNKVYSGEILINVLNEIELYATKINALINRAKARDLYDIYRLIVGSYINDIKEFRKAFIYYSIISGDVDLLSDKIFERINVISKRDIDRQLKPMLMMKSIIDLPSMIKAVKDYINELVKFDNNEIEFIKKCKEKQFCPELLFPSNKKLKTHPMALYRMKF